MRRWLIGLLVGIVAVAGILAWRFNPFAAAVSPAVGNWKVIYTEDGNTGIAWLIRIEEKGGRLQGKILDGNQSPDNQATLRSVHADGNTLCLDFQGPNSCSVVVRLPPDEVKPATLLGTLGSNGRYYFLRMERTEQSKFSPTETRAWTSPLLDAIIESRKVDLEEFVRNHPGEPATCDAILLLMRHVQKDPSREKDVQDLSEQAMAIAALYGPEMECQVARALSHELSASGHFPALQLKLARQTVELLPRDAPTALHAATLRVFVSALRRAGKVDELPPHEAALARFEETLDQEFLKTSMPFQPDPFSGRKEKSDRAVLVELFTGAQCPPCIAADVAFDALLKTFRPTEAVLLQYHLHVPRPDPMTNRDTQKRAEFYEVAGTPMLFLNGKPDPDVGGYREHAQKRYDKLRKDIAEQLETPAQAQLQLTAQREGNKVELRAEVSQLKETGDSVRLRFVVIEDVVRYQGRNGQRLHHHVVRAFPGGIEGLALREKAGTHTAAINLAELRQTLDDYLAKLGKEEGFPPEDRPLELKRLKAVAFVQDNSTREVLQAIQVDIPAADR